MRIKSKEIKRNNTRADKVQEKMVIRFLTCDGPSLSLHFVGRKRVFLSMPFIIMKESGCLERKREKKRACPIEQFPSFVSSFFPDEEGRRTLKKSKIMAARGHIFGRRFLLLFFHTKKYIYIPTQKIFIFLKNRNCVVEKRAPCRSLLGSSRPSFLLLGLSG